MITANLVLWGRNASRVAESLEPDNMPNMHFYVDGESLRLEFSAEKIGTLLSTADDLLMNIKIAEDTLACAEEL